MNKLLCFILGHKWDTPEYSNWKAKCLRCGKLYWEYAKLCTWE